MKQIIDHYDSLKAAIDSEQYEEAGQNMVQLDQSIRQLFATPPKLSDSEQAMLTEISHFLLENCDNMMANQVKIESELATFSKAKQMKKAYNTL